MKRFSDWTTSKIDEHSVTSDVNQGNEYPNTGSVTNHLTPVGNIVTSLRNLFSPFNGVVVSVAEDGFSVKLNSSKFTSKEMIDSVLYDTTIMRGTTMAQYIMQQGLPKVKIIDLGQFSVVYFCPDDIKGAGNASATQEEMKCQEMLDYNIQEAEMMSLNESGDDDEELTDKTREELSKIISSKDKVKAAKELQALILGQIELPNEYYFAGVKSSDGDESIALRWRYNIRRPNDNTSSIVRSIMNIYDESKNGVWVQDFDKDALFNLPDEAKQLIKSILDFIGAKETNDPCVFSLLADDIDDKKSSKDDAKKDDTSDDNEEDTKEKGNKADDDDNEDDSSRGEDSLS